MNNESTYPMNAQYFDMDTSTLSNEEVGVYLRLLNACWIKNGIPKDAKKLSRICRISLVEFTEIWSEIECYFFESNDQLFNKKQEETRKYINQQKANGSKGGRPKKESETKPKRKRNETQTETQTETETETETKPKQNLFDEIKEVEQLKKIDRPDFEKVIEVFNSVCTNLPSVQKLTKQRKSAINIRAKEYSLEKIKQVFIAVSKNEYLNGGGNNGWKADFDWIMNPNNFIKILEGKYDYSKKTQHNKKENGYITNHNQPTVNRQTAAVVASNSQGWEIG